MRRWLVLFFVLLLPLQFIWSAAAAHCQHETSEQQTQHFGHHFHVHQGEAGKPSDSTLMADADCASCHASAAAAIHTGPDGRDFAAAPSPAEAVAPPPFTSALARAP